MKDFHRRRDSREGGGFGKAAAGRSGERKAGRFDRGEPRRFGRRGPDERPSFELRRGEPVGRVRPQMHSAVCAKCGKSCEVPFKPIPSKPVYCSNCYNRDDTRKRPAQVSDELERINEKLDRILRALSLD